MKRILWSFAISLILLGGLYAGTLRRSNTGGGSGVWPLPGTPADILDGDQTGGSGATGIFSSTIAVINASQAQSFQIGGSTVIVIDPNSNVGVGITQPSTKFDVGVHARISSLSVVGALTSTTPIVAPVPAALIRPGALAANVMGSSVAAQSVEVQAIKATGIGSTKYLKGDGTWDTPAGGAGGSSGDKITSSTMTTINGALSGANETAASIQVNSSTKGYVDGSGNLRWGSFTSNRQVVISSNNRVGIGTQQPSFPLHVEGDAADGNSSNVIASFGATNMSNPKVFMRAPASTTGGVSLLFGTSASGSSASIFYGYSVIGTVYNILRFGLSSAAPDLLVLTDSNRVGVGISTPSANLHVSTGAGSGGPLFIVSTGTSNLFEVNGTSIVAKVQLFSPDGSPYSTTSVAGSGGPEADTLALSQVGRLVSTNTVGITWVDFTSATIRGELAVAGGSAVMKSTQAVIKVMVTDTSDSDFEVAEDSVSISVGGTMVKLSTDQANTAGSLNNKRIDATLAGNVLITTFTYGVPGPVYFSSMAVINTTATSNGLGEAILAHNESSATVNVAYRKMWIAANNPAQEFTFHFAEQSSGTVRGNRHYVLSMATASANGGNYSTVTKRLPIAFTVTTPIDGPGSTMTNVTTTGWSNLVGPGGCWLFVFVGRDDVGHSLDTSLNPTMTDASGMTGGFIQ